ncbi:STAS domain-containing protein [Propionivibrio sp.]|uniref:STAS domain-containing protein n=1 Tax=Propionivibrio sp. TaxID=2212460 RepID=UPI0026328498|nr:STAS domain-containing protein [Propionivibrio sp.]
MVAKPAAVPRSTKKPESASALAVDGQDAQKPPRAVGVAAPPEPAKDAPVSFEFTDFVFSEGAVHFQVEADVDPVDAEAEEAAILFANGQDEAVGSVLENAVRIHHFGPGERLWLMLFDFYRLSGKKAAFEALEIEYAKAFEKSPPGWRDKSKGQSKTVEATAGSLLFRGDLTGDNNAAFDAIRQALEKNPRLRLDLSKVSRLDAAGCGRLLAQLQQARKAKRELDLLGRDTLGTLVEACVESGRAEDKECWLLLLELCQLQGQCEAFEEVAINYAVTFEVSPPSWEAKRVAVPEPVLQMAKGNGDSDVVDAYVMHGDIKASRFADLPAHAEVHDPVLIECGQLTRMDFISAGALLNVLTTIRQSGKQIIFRHPNHLVAELFGTVGLKAIATIVSAKY